MMTEKMNPEREQAGNLILQKRCAEIFQMLSEFGKEIFYVTDGILGQWAQAKREASCYNATLGEAAENKKPLYLSVMHEKIGLFSAEEIYPYSPPSGDFHLRQLWKQKMCMENPSLKEEFCSLPVVTCGLTHGLSLTADLFVNAGDVVIHADQCWENYDTIYGIVHKGKILKFSLFDKNRNFNVEDLRIQIEKSGAEKIILLLNFPNNPTGYTLSEDCADRLIKMVAEKAEMGIKMVIVVDDAYYGFFYTEECIRESLFARLAGLHPNILPIRLDGVTKEMFASGIRVGFMTFGAEGRDIQKVLEQKAAGTIRASISSCSHPSQSLVAAALEHPELTKELSKKRNIIRKRAEKILQIIRENRYKDAWEFYPFNSGYFVCLKLKYGGAQEIRHHLLKQYQTGVIALNDTDIRISFLCLDEQDIDKFFEVLYRGVKECKT